MVTGKQKLRDNTKVSHVRQVHNEAGVPLAQKVPSELLDFIRCGSSFIVAGHKEPDGDCVGSQLALTSVLRRMGKQAIACSPGPFKRLEIKPFEHLFSKPPPGVQDTRVIIADCSTANRLGDLQPLLEGLPTMVIDHHENACEPLLYDGYLDGEAFSTTYLVHRVIYALGLSPNKEEAEMLFLGLCTDTGFFRHVEGNSGGAEVFETAADLVRCGADPKAAFAAMYGGKSLRSRKLIGQILLNAESLFEGRLIISCEGQAETKTYGAESRDSDTLYQLLQSVDGVQAIVIIRQESQENCTVGFRSRDWVDVGSIAESFGGGGHKNAAGLYIQGTIAELKQEIIRAFENIF
ncbi:MAG: bifunctional oligoribonuclease/PAP phosphatase NrnA [Treponema sp.]|nr:bifunctional oligoribonuclease/PAP phosphatase NrnA [Treponema sp.]